MDNKIRKITVFLNIIILFFLLSFLSCLGWLDRESFYEIKLNDDVSLLYFSDDGKFYGYDFELYPSPVELYYSSDKWPEKYKYVRLGGDPMRKRLEQSCKKVVYNDSIILCALWNYKYCQYKVDMKDGKKVLQRIELTAEQFDALVSACPDCDYYDVEKLKNMKWE